MKKIVDRYTNNIFENIKHIDEHGNEYWYARDLSKVLEYKDWRNFLKVLNKAKEACKNSGFNIDEQLVKVNKLSKRNNNATANIQDYKLSRYICYLIVQNADPNKEVVALGQTYFAIQTRKQEITEHINNILNSGKLDENNTVGKTDIDNSKKTVKIYNLDMIIAVGYKVNSKKATNFDNILNETRMIGNGSDK